MEKEEKAASYLLANFIIIYNKKKKFHLWSQFVACCLSVVLKREMENFK